MSKLIFAVIGMAFGQHIVEIEGKRHRLSPEDFEYLKEHNALPEPAEPVRSAAPEEIQTNVDDIRERISTVETRLEDVELASDPEAAKKALEVVTASVETLKSGLDTLTETVKAQGEDHEKKLNALIKNFETLEKKVK